MYPREWRDRFGDEFAALLVDEMRDRRYSLLRDGNVIVHALLAHLTAAGLAGGRLTSRVQAGRAPRLLGVLIAVRVGKIFVLQLLT